MKKTKTVRTAVAKILILIFLVCGYATAEEVLRPFAIVAHRGVKKFAPENTIPAIEKAIEMGLDYVEMDIRQTADGEMVLMHNSTVDATTDGTGAVADMMLEEIKKLDAGAKFSEEFKGIRVPTVREAFAMMSGKIGGYLDFKAGDTEKLVALIEEFDMVDDVVLYSGMDKAAQIQKLNKKIKIMPGADNEEQLLLLIKTMDIKAVETSVNHATKKFIKTAHAHGVLVFMDILGPLDNPTGMKQAIKLGADAIQTDNADVLLELISTRTPR